MVVFLFSLLLTGISWSTGAFIFSHRPDKTVYFLEGSSAVFEWRYSVGDRKREFNFLQWNMIKDNTQIPLFVENVNGTITSFAIPSPYVGRLKKTGQATLVLTNITFNDSVSFQCVLSGNFEQNFDTVGLVVTGHASVFPQIHCAKFGDSVTFTCNATGVPSGNFVWSKDHGESKELLSTGSPVLVLGRVAGNDTGYYECNATANPNQPNIAQSYLEVLKTEPLQEDDKASPERSFSIAIGDQKTLCCPIKGYPPPIVTWQKNGVLLQTKVDKCYPITSAKDDQFGNYTCSATDGTKSSGPYTFSLTKKLSIGVQASESGTLGWSDVPGAQYYVVKITGNDILDDVTCLVGKQPSMDLHFNTLVLKEPKKNLEETKVCVKVVALSEDEDVIAKTPTCQSMIIKSGQVTLKPNIMFLLVLVYTGWKML